MTADRARGALAVLQDADGKFLCEVPCGYIVEQTASAHKPRRIQAQRRRRAMLRRRVALTVALLTVAALLAALMPWSGSGAADKPKDTTAGTLEEVHQPTAVLLPSSGTAAEYVPNAAEVEALAKLIYGEAGIVPSTTEQAAVVWCVLNRVDDPRFPDTVLEVIEAPYQFSGYDPEYPVKEEFALLAADVLTRYRAERDGEENVGRVLPAEYCFFTGDGSAVYPVVGLPQLDKESLLTIFDVPEKDRDNYFVKTLGVPAGISFEDTDETERHVEREGISIIYSGRTLKPIRTTRGLVFIESRYLSPVADVLDVLELYERRTAEGAPYIVAKAGFLLQAVIMPYDVINQQFVESLQDLTRECEFSLSEKERREREARDRFTFTEPEQCSLNVDPNTGEVVEGSEVAET